MPESSIPTPFVLARLGERGAEIPVALDAGGIAWDLRTLTADIDAAFWAKGGFAAVADGLENGSFAALGADGLRVGAPVARPGKVVCIGRNYRDHAAETGGQVESEPVIFMKTPYTVSGPYDDVMPLRGSTTFDYEVELAFVIASTASYLSKDEDPMDCVGGFCVANDLSDREMQFSHGGSQWDNGKNFPRSCPLGPWLVPYSAFSDYSSAVLELKVNGEIRQSEVVSNMVFDVPYLVRYLSNCMTLEPGDLVLTGTPSGVAYGMAEPKGYLRPGDVVEASITNLGAQRLLVVQS